MSTPPETSPIPIPDERQVRGSHFVDLSPLKESPAFARLWAGNAIAGIGSQMTVVAIGLHVYELTGSTGSVALVGVLSLLPMIIAGLYGGMLADAFDRRKVALIASCVAWGSTILLAALAWTHAETVWSLYALSILNAVAATVIGTSRQAILPRILPPHLLPAASALGGISLGVMVTVGPALAGVLVASVGFQWTYTVDAVLFLAAFTGVLALPRIAPEGEVQRPGLASIRYGLGFLRTAPNIRMSFIVDIIAMTFGQPRVLFPAVGAVVLGGGPVTVGILTAAGAVGSLVSSVLSGSVGRVTRHGRAIRWAIVAYGLSTAGFGVVLLLASKPGVLHGIGSRIEDASIPGIVAASVLLALTGAADNISSIFRNTMLQTAVPDNMRGRLQGIFIVVVTGGPRLGDAYIGIVTLFAYLWVPSLVGGLLIAVVVWILIRALPSFEHYDSRNPTP
ncbi:MFS transporter [Clavibacter michiganensis]|uniref:MFS transporter n=1 Tax=Clavibacter michiganensis TaxID=28447 RepID=UPI003EB878F6